MKKDWYDYLTPEFKLDKSVYRVNERYSFDCPHCGKSGTHRLNHIKSKIKDLGYYKCSKCRKKAGVSIARDAFIDKYGNKNPYELESVKKKIKKTNLDRHGVECILSKPEIHKAGITAATKLRDSKRKYKIDYSQISCKSTENKTQWMKEYDKLRRSTDHEYVARQKVYGAIRRMMLGSKKSKTNVLKNIGYTNLDLKNHLESLFEPGMSWENYGEWHLDHIKPLSLFDCTKESEIIKANQLENLQPLWARDNLKKSNKY